MICEQGLPDEEGCGCKGEVEPGLIGDGED